MSTRLTILCAGMIAADPGHGGATWAVLQYLLGFRQLGHDVYFVEPVPAAKLAPEGGPASRAATATYFQQVVSSFGLSSSAALLVQGTTETVGMSYDALLAVARRSDLLVNISGMLTEPALLEVIPRRVYLDLDPGFNQAWHTESGIDMRFDSHTHFATVGLAMGRAECRVPLCGKRWITTCPPVVLGEWPVARRLDRDAFTTVANWRSYGSLQFEDLFLGQKAHSLRPLVTLPQKTTTRFELALTIHESEPDLSALRHAGWNLADPYVAAGTPRRYRQFIRGSRAEFGIAKSGYVAVRSGWFSDRSVCYLASGRPVLAQQTGFAHALPTGEGLLSFETEADVLAGLDSIASDYPRHRAAARAVAEQHFDSNRVLTRLLDTVGAAS